jgi:uncharacterized membrane protein
MADATLDAKATPVAIGSSNGHRSGVLIVTDPVPEAPATMPVPSASLISTTLVLYALFGVAAVIALFSHGFPLVAPLMGLVGIIALIIAYVKRADAAGTWLASHYRWLIRTFWFSLLWGVVGGLILITLGLILIGIPIAFAIWIVTTVWVIYRLVRGYLLFNDSKPVPGM